MRIFVCFVFVSIFVGNGYCDPPKCNLNRDNRSDFLLVDSNRYWFANFLGGVRPAAWSPWGSGGTSQWGLATDLVAVADFDGEDFWINTLSGMVQILVRTYVTQAEEALGYRFPSYWPTILKTGFLLRTTIATEKQTLLTSLPQSNRNNLNAREFGLCGAPERLPSPNFKSLFTPLDGATVPTETPVGDYDGDSIPDRAIAGFFANGKSQNSWWTITLSSAGVLQHVRPFAKNAPAPVVVAMDVNGDGKHDFVTWDPATGEFKTTLTSDQSKTLTTQWGLSGDIPLSNVDFDGDRKHDYSVYRPSEGRLYYIPSSGAAPFGNPWLPGYFVQWGLPNHQPIAPGMTIR